MTKIKSYLLFFFGCLLLSKSVFAVDPELNWKTIENKNFYVHYAQGNKAIAERVMAIAEAAHLRLTVELNWTPKDRTHLVLSDETDQPNGFASPLFFNYSVIFLAPPTSVNTLEDFDDWLTTLIVHEYTHIIHLDKSAGAPAKLRHVFGRFFLLFPNLFQPSWITEGLATYKETDFEHGTGRGQSAMAASMMRMEVLQGVQPISHVNLPVATWPAGSTRYLYGVYFMRFIGEVYGADKRQQWIEEYSDNLLPFLINTTANKVLGNNLTVIWAEYELWLNDKFLPQIDAITARGIKAGKQLSESAYRTNTVRAIKNKKGVQVYYVQNNGYKRASLIHIDETGKRRELIELNGAAQLDLHASAGILLTQNEFCNNYTMYSDIFLFDTDSNELKRLTQCGRYLFASWFPDGKQIVAVQHNAGKFELQLLDETAQLKTVLWQANNHEIIAQIDVSADGKQLVASVWRKGYGWNIELFDIESRRWKNVTRGTNIAAYPQFTAAGDIMFSMEANNVYNLYRYHMSTGKVEQLSNVLGGAFQSSQAVVGGAIYYSGYSAQGFAIYKMQPESMPVSGDDVTRLAEAQLISEAFVFSDDRLQLVDYNVTTHEQRKYSAWSSLTPRWWFPDFEFSEQRSRLGLSTGGADALGIHQYLFSVAHDTQLDETTARLAYAYAERLFFSWARINDVYLDNAGAVSRVTRRDVASLTLAYQRRLVQKQSNLLFSIISDHSADRKRVDNAQPWAGVSDHILGIAWLSNSADVNPLSISLIDGHSLRLVAEDSSLLNSDFSGQVYTFDWQQYIRIGKESVIALRFLQGWGVGSPQLFRLGGEGFSQNALDLLLSGAGSEGVFDRRSYALRGYREGLPQLRGRRVQLLSGEWRFPLQRIERGIMAPPVGIMQWFATLFVETGTAYQHSPETYYSSAGFEISADINLYYGVLLRARLGYAHGFDHDIGDDRLYLKIGSSF